MDSGKDRQEKYELLITADSVQSTDERFTMDNLSLGDNYKPLDAYFRKENGDIIKRSYRKANEEIQTRRCHVSHFRYLKSKYLPCL